MRFERRGLYVLDSPDVVRSLGVVQTRIIRPSQSSTYGVRWSREDLVLWGDGRARPNLGLANLLGRRAEHLGETLEIVGDQPFVSLHVDRAGPARNGEMIAWLASHELGIIEYGPQVALVDILREILSYFSGQASIAVVFGSERQLRRTTQPLTASRMPGTLLRQSLQAFEEPPRIAIGTFRDFVARRDVGIHDYDLVLVPRATDALGTRAEGTLSDPCMRGRLIGLLPSNEGLSPASRARLMATFGPSRFRLPAAGHVERPVFIARLALSRRRIVAYDDPVLFLRHNAWCNGRLNREIAHVAESIANGSTVGLRISPSESTHLPNLGSDRVVLLACDNAEHATELAAHLPHWILSLGGDCHHDGLSERQLRTINRPFSESPFSAETWRRRVLSADALNQADLSNVAIIIWCGTGGGLPPIASRALWAESGSQIATQPLLIIDVRDPSHVQFRRAATDRMWLYGRRGWLPFGVHPETAISGIFDDELFGLRSRQAAARRARRRTWIGESLPRRVFAGRSYLRRRSATAQEGVGATANLTPGLANLPTLTQVTHHEHLLEVYYRLRGLGGPGAGSDGLSFADFSHAEIAAVLRGVSAAIRAGRYRPHQLVLFASRNAAANGENCVSSPLSIALLRPHFTTRWDRCLIAVSMHALMDSALAVLPNRC